jgi:hypothetical protein
VVQPATRDRGDLGGRFVFCRKDCQARHGDEVMEPGVSRSMINRWRKRYLRGRVLAYAAAAILAFAIAAGVGATVALMMQGGLNVVPGGQEPRPAAQQDDAPQRQGAAADEPQKEDAGAGREAEEAASPLNEAEYASRIGDIQSNSVETFLDSHDKLLRYDALTADDVAEMQANENALEEMTEQTGDLTPPSKYEEQYDVFRAAVGKLYEATQLAYDMAADPVAAAELGFDEYDRRVQETTDLLQRSNEMLGQDYKTTKGTREISPELSAKEAIGGLGRA